MNWAHVNTLESLLEAEVSGVTFILDDKTVLKLRDSIIRNYGFLSRFARENGLDYRAFVTYFRKNKQIRCGIPGRVLKILSKKLNFPMKEILTKIRYTQMHGSHRGRTIIPNTIVIDPLFVEGFALYIAEGDTGLSGKHRSRKVRLTNSEKDIIVLFSRWVKRYLKMEPWYSVYVPEGNGSYNIDWIYNMSNNVNINKCKYCKIPKYRLNLDCSLFMDLFFLLEPIVKKECLRNKKLAEAYIRGMLAGEGTVYFKEKQKTRYVRIEMKNEGEIKYISSLLSMLNIKHGVSERNTRKGMWTVYVGSPNIISMKNIGFGASVKRQNKFEGLIRSVENSCRG